MQYNTGFSEEPHLATYSYTNATHIQSNSQFGYDLHPTNSATLRGSTVSHSSLPEESSKRNLIQSPSSSILHSSIEGAPGTFSTSETITAQTRLQGNSRPTSYLPGPSSDRGRKDQAQLHSTIDTNQRVAKPVAKINQRSSRQRRSPAKPKISKPPLAYERAASAPSGIFKLEDDSCLTCISQNRKCRGTVVELDKDGKPRCQWCAHPIKKDPTSTASARKCYWREEENGILTYEQAQAAYGRTIQKNTRAGIQERCRLEALQEHD